MTRQFRAAVLGVILAISLLPVSVLAAEQAKPAPPAPIPAQIVGAKKVFVGNAGGDQLLGLTTGSSAEDLIVHTTSSMRP